MKRLAQYLKEKNLTIAQLEKKARLPRTTLWNIMNGSRNAGVKTLRRLSKATGLTFEELLQ